MFRNLPLFEYVAPKTIKASLGLLRDKALSHELIDHASEKADKEASLVTDIRASKVFRREMVRIVTRRVPKERA